MLITLKGHNGGLGVEQNVVTMCPECHFEEDMGKDTKVYEQKVKTYLQSKYDEWRPSELIYRKN